MWQKRVKFFCVDCEGWRYQKFKLLLPAKYRNAIYVCETCGCENELEEQMQDS